MGVIVHPHGHIPLWIPKLLTNFISNTGVSGGYDSIPEGYGDLSCYSAYHPWNVVILYLANLKLIGLCHNKW